MLRSGDTIRLTSEERSVFDSVAGGKGLQGPKTVAEHNQILQNASEFYAQGDSAEEKLLAHLAQDLKIAD